MARDLEGTRIVPGPAFNVRNAFKTTPDAVIAVGDILAITGGNAAGTYTVAKADANNRAHTRGMLLVATQVTSKANAPGSASPYGFLINQNTSGLAVGDKVYLSNTAGGWSSTPGEWPRQIGTVVSVHATTGKIAFNGLLPHDRTKTVSGTILSGQTSLTIAAATLGGSYGGGKIIGVVGKETSTNPCYFKSVVWSTHDLVVTVNTDPGASNYDFDVTFSLE